MKKIVLLFTTLSVLLFASCDAIKDAATVDVDTNLEADVPLEAAEEGSISMMLKSSNALGDFTGSAKIDLSENDDLAAYLEDLKDITADEINVKLENFTAELEISTMTFTAVIEEGATKSQTLTAITSENAAAQTLSDLIPLINEWDITTMHVVTFSVTGSANQTIPEGLKAKIKIPATVKYQLIN